MQENKHYICNGGCRGVSQTSGVCQAGDCAKHGEPLEGCDCADMKHGEEEKSDKEDEELIDNN